MELWEPPKAVEVRGPQGELWAQEDECTGAETTAGEGRVSAGGQGRRTPPHPLTLFCQHLPGVKPSRWPKDRGAQCSSLWRAGRGMGGRGANGN